MTKTRTVSVTTSWAALPSIRCGSFSLLNNTGANISFTRTEDTGDSTTVITIPTGKNIVATVNGSMAEFSIKASAGAAGVEICAEQIP